VDEGRRFVSSITLSPFFQLNFHPSSFTFHLMMMAAAMLFLMFVFMLMAAAMLFFWLLCFVIVLMLMAAAMFAFVFFAEVESQGVKQQACQQNSATDIEPRCFLCRTACL
jgi:uncharacterized membrane protein